MRDIDLVLLVGLGVLAAQGCETIGGSALPEREISHCAFYLPSELPPGEKVLVCEVEE